MNLPYGWEVKRTSTWDGPRLKSRRTVYVNELRAMTVTKVGRFWMLVRNFHDNGSRYSTAKDAITFAEMLNRDRN